MAVLFDSTDDYARSVLDRATVHGEITLADLESILERTNITTTDIADTINALADMGIEIDDGLTQEMRDAAFDQSMKEWCAKGNLLPSLTGEGWAMILRAMEREKAGAKPSRAELAAAAREITAKRTFTQSMFAGFGPRLRRKSPVPATSEMLTEEEKDALRREAKQNSAFFKKAFAHLKPKKDF